jgi:predicted amidohydrolase
LRALGFGSVPVVVSVLAESLLLRDVRPVDALHGERGISDVLVRDGRIVTIDTHIEAPGVVHAYIVEVLSSF